MKETFFVLCYRVDNNNSDSGEREIEKNLIYGDENNCISFWNKKKSFFPAFFSTHHISLACNTDFTHCFGIIMELTTIQQEEEEEDSWLLKRAWIDS